MKQNAEFGAQKTGLRSNLLRLYEGKTCAITGGASFIGSHLAELLIEAGARVKVIDDLSSGCKENLSKVASVIDLEIASVTDRGALDRTLAGTDVVFHLAAIHGGRGFIDTYPERMLENLALDWAVFSRARSIGVRRVVHASSACVYPINLQASSDERLLLQESLAGFEKPEQSFPDGAYGWAKLMGEFQLKTIVESSQNMTGRSARIFTAYGSKENESHAIVALWAKAALELDPYPVWGDGEQTRNFTHVSDTVHGLALLGTDARQVSYDAFNIGSSTHHTVRETAYEIFSLRGWQPKDFDYQLDRPVGVRSRAADNSKIKKVFGWEPTVSLKDGLLELGQWFDNQRLPSMDVDELEARLIAR